MGIPQGNLKLLDTELAKSRLNSTIPARLAYIWLSTASTNHTEKVTR